MNHLSMEQLLQLQGPATDPGVGDARAHVASCPSCQAELDRLHQRVARLKALPALRPARDSWPVVHSRFTVERKQRQTSRWMGIAGLAMAASVILAVVLTDVSNVDELAAGSDGFGSIHESPAIVGSGLNATDYKHRGGCRHGAWAVFLDDANLRQRLEL